VIPQAVCSRHGLAVGANLVWLVKILMVLCFPISYPVGKILDYLLGHNDSALFRRAQLKALVSIHGKEAGKGGDLTHDETTIIQGALDLTEKVWTSLSRMIEVPPMIVASTKGQVVACFEKRLNHMSSNMQLMLIRF
jgi:metal transporter CNNM